MGNGFEFFWYRIGAIALFGAIFLICVAVMPFGGCFHSWIPDVPQVFAGTTQRNFNQASENNNESKNASPKAAKSEPYFEKKSNNATTTDGLKKAMKGKQSKSGNQAQEQGLKSEFNDRAQKQGLKGEFNGRAQNNPAQSSENKGSGSQEGGKSEGKGSPPGFQSPANKVKGPKSPYDYD